MCDGHMFDGLEKALSFFLIAVALVMLSILTFGISSCIKVNKLEQQITVGTSSLTINGKVYEEVRK